MQPRPLIALADVEAGSRWFCEVLGLRSAHGGPEYDQLMDGDVMIAQLHDWDPEEHPHLGDPADPSRGNGVLLWFVTRDFEGLLARVTAHGATVLEGPLFNEQGRQREIWLQGPEGYRVVVAGPSEWES
ncbi:MAG: VOC family protein [Myxococcota bacterium]